ncbi:hypothetical protein VT84_35545 [Gemmata sp. SH-PL17]|uniref:hypothetical protein n=1 Tax=Gemmata sp. SH-PL17 TaxID=1630693 RepID=UPI00078C1067|nr:hypothetical protein [Gemmata sp. SH-PL17]AMV29762.1 hypothetical protein VT84_35545 [Gemmata sp. SH-PL17]
MKTKAFALAAMVVAGVLSTAGSADAQYRYRGSRSYTYTNPTYYAPVYTAPVYTAPTYNGVVGVGAYTPLGGTSMVVPSGYSSSYYSPTYTPTYTYPTYSYSYPTYGSFYSGGVYTSPGGAWYGRGWRR